MNWHRFNWLLAVALCGFALGGNTATAEPRPDIARLIINSEPVRSSAELLSRSPLIVYGRIAEPASGEYPTGKRAGQGQLVNRIQTVRILRVLKGKTPGQVSLLTTGVKPLPLPDDPLTRKYTGPLAEDDYVLFLRKVTGSDLFSLVGVWQGVYPVHDGKTIALTESGFPELHDLTVAQLVERLQRRTSLLISLPDRGAWGTGLVRTRRMITSAKQE